MAIEGDCDAPEHRKNGYDQSLYDKVRGGLGRVLDFLAPTAPLPPILPELGVPSVPVV